MRVEKSPVACIYPGLPYRRFLNISDIDLSDSVCLLFTEAQKDQIRREIAKLGPT